MKIKRSPFTPVGVIIALVSVVAIIALFGFLPRAQAVAPAGSRLVTIYDRGQEMSVITSKDTLREVFAEIGLVFDENDIVEPGVDEQLVGDDYQVNLYRARPVVIEDETQQIKVMSASQTPEQITQEAGIEMRAEDEAELQLTSDIMSDGASERLVIDRAVPVNFVLYSSPQVVYTQATTVGEFVEEKGIKLAANDQLSLPVDTPITADMTLELWRNGKQTINVDEEVNFPVEQVKDANYEIGYKEVRTPGVKGKRTVTYEVEMQAGKVISRTEIQSVQTKEPSKQIEVVGIRNKAGGLTKGMGVKQFTDSNGVTHRETYYDLPMNRVMTNCGAGGAYSVRDDGVKVDPAGFVIIAAHLGNYPRCSVVETSVGPGKVYDTGGFTSAHPHGFDLATDWTNYDGI